MQSKLNSDILFPPVPESYRTRMEAVLASLPTEQRVSRGLSKKQSWILAAALAVLLIASVAVAAGLSRLEAMKEASLAAAEELTRAVQGEPVQTEALASPAATAYLPLSVGTNDKGGEWRPSELTAHDDAVTVGNCTIRLVDLDAQNTGMLYVGMRLSSDVPEEYEMTDLCLSIDGGSPLPDRWNNPIDPTPEREDAHTVYHEATFSVGENPLKKGAVLTFSGKLNGEPFALSVSLTEERFEALRQQTLGAIEAYTTMLDAIPEDAIPVGASTEGYIVSEIAVRGHWLYFTMENDRAYWAEKGPYASRGEVPNSTFDHGFYATIDGMVLNPRFISAELMPDGSWNTQLHRSFLPYPDALPEESLVSIEGSVFRVRWATGTVTLPKDEAEYLAWRRESEQLSLALRYDTDAIARPAAKANGFTATDLIFENQFLEVIGLVLETPDAVGDAHLAGSCPVVTVGGVALEPYPYSDEEPDRIEGRSENGDTRHGFLFFGPALGALPESFEVTVAWRGETLTFTLHQSDFTYARATYEEYGYVLHY